MSPIYPETDGWDDAANENPKVRWTKRIFILASVLFFIPCVWVYFRYVPWRLTEEFPSGARAVYYVDQYDYWFRNKRTLKMPVSGSLLTLYDAHNKIALRSSGFHSIGNISWDVYRLDEYPYDFLFEISEAREYFLMNYVVYAITEMETSVPVDEDFILKVLPVYEKALTRCDWTVKPKVIEAVGRIGTKDIIPILMNALNDCDVVGDAALILGEMGVIEALPELTKVRYWGYNHLYPAHLAISSLAEQYSVETVDNAEKRRNAISFLIKGTTDDDPDIRVLSIKLLGEIRAVDAIPHVFAALKDKVENVRDKAIYTLVTFEENKLIDSTEIVLLLIEALNNEYWDIRHSASNLLGLYKSEAIVAVPELLRLLSDEKWVVRAAAAEALGEIGALDALPGLERALEVEDVEYAIEDFKEAIRKLTEAKIAAAQLDAESDSNPVVPPDASDSIPPVITPSEPVAVE